MTPELEWSDHYLSQYERHEHERGGDSPDWLRKLRRSGIDDFVERGFPTTRDEEWRFTNVAPIAATTFAPAWDLGTISEPKPDLLESFGLPDSKGPRLVFVGGRFVPGLSHGLVSDGGIHVTDLTGAFKATPDIIEKYLDQSVRSNRNAFSALNTAFVHDGAFIYVPAHQGIKETIHLVFVGTGYDQARMAHPRVLVVAEQNSQVRVIETYVSPSGASSLTNAVTEVVLDQNAVVDHYKVQQEDLKGFHIGEMYVQLDRGSNFSSHSITLGGPVARNDVMARLGGEGGSCTLNGLYLADGHRLVDNHTTIDHAEPHCESHEVYKGILSGFARGVFNGKIIVRPDAQKTDAKQTNKALLLSDNAQINTKPQLEIFADDVKCTHGATIGQLDDEALFYLRTRGISQQDAASLLIHAFARDVIDRVSVDELRAYLHNQVVEQLPKTLIGEARPAEGDSNKEGS